MNDDNCQTIIRMISNQCINGSSTKTCMSTWIGISLTKLLPYVTQCWKNTWDDPSVRKTYSTLGTLLRN